MNENLQPDNDAAQPLNPDAALPLSPLDFTQPPIGKHSLFDVRYEHDEGGQVFRVQTAAHIPNMAYVYEGETQIARIRLTDDNKRIQAVELGAGLDVVRIAVAKAGKFPFRQQIEHVLIEAEEKEKNAPLTRNDQSANPLEKIWASLSIAERLAIERPSRIRLAVFGSLTTAELQTVMNANASASCVIVGDFVHFVSADKPVSMGRTDTNDIPVRLSDKTSRSHAELSVKSEQRQQRRFMKYILRDVGSKNGSQFLLPGQSVFRDSFRAVDAPANMLISFALGDTSHPLHLTNPAADVRDVAVSSRTVELMERNGRLKHELDMRRAAPQALQLQTGGTDIGIVFLRRGTNYLARKNEGGTGKPVRYSYKTSESPQELLAEGYTAFALITTEGDDAIEYQPYDPDKPKNIQWNMGAFNSLYPGVDLSNMSMFDEQEYTEKKLSQVAGVNQSLTLPNGIRLTVKNLRSSEQQTSPVIELTLDGKQYKVDCGVLFARADDSLRSDREKQRQLATELIRDHHAFRKLFGEFIPQWDETLLEQTEVATPENWDSFHEGMLGHHHRAAPAGQAGEMHRVTLPQDIMQKSRLLRNAIDFHEWLHEYARNIPVNRHIDVVEGGVTMLGVAGAVAQDMNLKDLHSIDLHDSGIRNRIINTIQSNFRIDYLENARAMTQLAGKMHHGLGTFAYALLRGDKHFIPEIAARFSDPANPTNDGSILIIPKIQGMLAEKRYDDVKQYIDSLAPRDDASMTMFDA